MELKKSVAPGALDARKSANQGIMSAHENMLPLPTHDINSDGSAFRQGGPGIAIMSLRSD